MSCGSTICTSTNYIQSSAPLFAGLDWSWRIPFAWLDRIALGCERRYQRRPLLKLDHRLLADIGVSREQAVEESFKSCWMRRTMRLDQ
jgi:uncharacterized protein YjiS (DUF1127 family)